MSWDTILEATSVTGLLKVRQTSLQRWHIYNGANDSPVTYYEDGRLGVSQHFG